MPKQKNQPTLHNDIVRVMHSIIDAQLRRETMGPNSLALAALKKYIEPDKLEIHALHGTLEGFKQIARGVLSGRCDIEGAKERAVQGDFFANIPQDAYPIPVPKGEEPLYKAYEKLTPDELRYNGRRFHKASAALAYHGDFLFAEADKREAAVTPKSEPVA